MCLLIWLRSTGPGLLITLMSELFSGQRVSWWQLTKKGQSFLLSHCGFCIRHQHSPKGPSGQKFHSLFSWTQGSQLTTSRYLNALLQPLHWHIFYFFLVSSSSVVNRWHKGQTSILSKAAAFASGIQQNFLASKLLLASRTSGSVVLDVWNSWSSSHKLDSP